MVHVFGNKKLEESDIQLLIGNHEEETIILEFKKKLTSNSKEIAKDMGGIIFGSDWFNDELKNCNLAYSNGWKILGIENEKCVISFIWDNDVDYEEGKITYNWIACELPYEIYSEADKIEWEELINRDYCKK